MPDQLKGEVKTVVDANTPQQSPSPSPSLSLPPAVEGSEVGLSDDVASTTLNLQVKEPLPTQWTVYVQAVCAISLVFITGFYTYYARQQTGASITAANAAKSASDTAAQTLQEMKDSAASTSAATLAAFKQEQRPYIVVTAYNVMPVQNAVYTGVYAKKGGTHFCIRFESANRGRTPALSIFDKVFVIYGKDGEKTVRRMKTPAYPEGAGEVMAPTPENSGEYGDACTDPIDEQTVSDLAKGTVDLYIYGSVQYKDIFGDLHETRYCGYRPAGFSPFHNCKYGNWMDKNPDPKM
jgi:hypothetical protein